MATTKIADVIVPSVFAPYVIQLTAELSALYQAGIVVEDPEIASRVGAGGSTVNMPFWNDLTGADEVLSDSGALTPEKIAAAQDVAAICIRGKAWGTNDLAKLLAGSDPMRAIATLVGAYWARRRQAQLISMLKGVFAASNMTGNLNNVAVANVSTTTPVNLDGNVIIDSLNKLGDAEGKLQALAIHSTVLANLKKLDLIDFIPDSEGKPTIATYQGRRVIVDDGMPKVAVTGGYKYLSVLFGQGAFGSGEGTLDADEAVETYRLGLAHESYLINRRHFILHPRGVKWTPAGGVPAGATPTNAEFEDGGNWSRVYEVKNVRMVGVWTNG